MCGERIATAALSHMGGENSSMCVGFFFVCVFFLMFHLIFVCLCVPSDTGMLVHECLYSLMYIVFF